VFSSPDLITWSSEGIAITEAELAGGTCHGNKAESPFVMQHPISGDWMLFVNGGYSVSADPLDFPATTVYPFASGWYFQDGKSGDWGDGTNLYANPAGSGYAHQVLFDGGQWYLSGVVGTDGHEKLKLYPIKWTPTALVGG
jgi:hypothetical protein